MDKIENRKATIAKKAQSFSPLDEITTDVLLDIKNLDSQKQQPVEDQVRNLTRFLLVQRQRQARDLTQECLEEIESSVERMYAQYFANEEIAPTLKMCVQQVIRDFAPVIPAPLKTSPRVHASVKSIDWSEFEA